MSAVDELRSMAAAIRGKVDEGRRDGAYCDGMERAAEMLDSRANELDTAGVQ